MNEIYQHDGPVFLCARESGISIFTVGSGADYSENELDPVTERIGELHAVSCSARFGGVCCCVKWPR